MSNNLENTQVGPFQIFEKLGAHKRHSVYRALQTEQNREVALKFIKVPPEVSPVKALSRIQRETKILKKMFHPNLVSVLGAGVEDDKIFFAQELVQGETLAAILTRRNRLAWDLAVEYARKISGCLEYIHSQEIVHLKLSPEKILITPDGDIKVSDLRLNRSKRRRWDSTNRRSIDRAAYMAPEQLTGGKGTAKSDFYALGVIIYEMCSGKLPYAPDTLSQMAAQKKRFEAPVLSKYTMECPIFLEKVVAQLLSVEPNERPHSARAISLALDEVKKIDETGVGVAEQIAGPFNPLTAGMDKKEAKKTLGIKERKLPGPAFYTTIPFLILCLVGIFIFFGYMLNPLTEQERFDRAMAWYELKDPKNLNSARSEFKEIIEKYPDGKYKPLAEEMVVKIRKIKLEKRADSNLTLERYPRVVSEKSFFEAWDLEVLEDYEAASKIYAKIIAMDSGDWEEQHVVELAAERLELLESKVSEDDNSETTKDGDEKAGTDSDSSSDSDKTSENQQGDSDAGNNAGKSTDTNQAKDSVEAEAG